MHAVSLTCRLLRGIGNHRIHGFGIHSYRVWLQTMVYPVYIRDNKRSENTHVSRFE